MSLGFMIIITVSNVFMKMGLLSVYTKKASGTYNIFSATLYTATGRPISLTMLNLRPDCIPMGRIWLTICTALLANSANLSLYKALIIPVLES